MGKRTSVYLSSDDLERVRSLGDPPLGEVFRAGLDLLEGGARPKRGKKPAAGTVPFKPPNLAPVTAEDCQHPMARRDPKVKNLCRACGSVL